MCFPVNSAVGTYRAVIAAYCTKRAVKLIYERNKHMPIHFSGHRRDTHIRIISFSVFMAAVLLSVIVLQSKNAEALAASKKHICGEILVRISEEHADLSAAFADNDTADIRRHADLLYSYAAMVSSFAHASGDTALKDAFTDTAQFYSALSDAAGSDTMTDPDFWKDCSETVAAHTASIALAISSDTHPSVSSAGERLLAERLSAFTSAFRTDPLRLPTMPQPQYSFDREIPVSLSEARGNLRSLIGNTVSFFGTDVTDDTHGCYIFSCQNGYAEVSLCGGHLLSYAFYPRSTADAAEHALSDPDLCSLAASFLKKAGISHKDTEQWNDRHGIRVFSVETNNGKTVTVGIRMHDGTVVRFDAQAYYRRDDPNAVSP